jgi:enamine deaminase RidA (YjgF/YER057c/UK114 family)
MTRTLNKKLGYLGVPWEEAYGYAQAVQVGNTVYVSGQLSYDDKGNLVGAAPIDAAGKVTDSGNMELQMRTTYENAIKLLAQFGATLDNVVEEVLYVTDLDAAFAVAGKVRKAAYGTPRPACASTISETSRLAFPQQLVEIAFTVVLE